MLARVSNLYSENGQTIKTPILIPSFSSKGWPFKKKSTGDEYSEVKEIIEWTTEFTTEAVLFSAYDLYYKHYPGPNELGEIADVIFIDSGGYEKLEDHDLSSVYRMPWPSKEWDIDKLRVTLSAIPKEYNIVIANYDDVKQPKPIKSQVQEAKVFFAEYPHYLNDILIRKETKTQDFIQLESVIANISLFREFDIIGLTEKELGSSLIERMEKIARIRTALDNENINSPLHIFGSLDPISSCLYFISGAEIFDGLTWLRYAYINGVATYNENFRFLKQDLKEKYQSSLKFIYHNNLMAIGKLCDEMILYARDGNFEHFTYHSKELQNSFNRLRAQLGG